MSTSITDTIALEHLRQEMIADLEHFLSRSGAIDSICPNGTARGKAAWPRSPMAHTPPAFPCYDAQVATAASAPPAEEIPC